MLKNYLNETLVEDGTLYGGLSYLGETLGEFLEGLELDYRKMDLKEVNELLVENGVEPLGGGF